MAHSQRTRRTRSGVATAPGPTPLSAAQEKRERWSAREARSFKAASAPLAPAAPPPWSGAPSRQNASAGAGLAAGSAEQTSPTSCPSGTVSSVPECSSPETMALSRGTLGGPEEGGMASRGGRGRWTVGKVAYVEIINAKITVELE